MREWPELNELVIATVEKVFEHGAYVKLDEYGKRGYVPLSEVSSRWVRNIRDYLKEGHKVVLKVIRVDPRKGHIDLSLRRVMASERKQKIYEWKRRQRALGILKVIAQKTGLREDEVIDKIGLRLEKHYGEALLGMEEIAKKGEKAALEAGIPKEYVGIVTELVKKQIKPRKVSIRGIMTLSCPMGDGILRIKRTITQALEGEPPNEGIGVEISYIGAPRYRIEVSAFEYKPAEKYLQRLIESFERAARENRVSFSFSREK